MFAVGVHVTTIDARKNCGAQSPWSGGDRYVYMMYATPTPKSGISTIRPKTIPNARRFGTADHTGPLQSEAPRRRRLTGTAASPSISTPFATHENGAFGCGQSLYVTSIPSVVIVTDDELGSGGYWYGPYTSWQRAK